MLNFKANSASNLLVIMHALSQERITGAYLVLLIFTMLMNEALVVTRRAKGWCTVVGKKVAWLSCTVKPLTPVKTWPNYRIDNRTPYSPATSCTYSVSHLYLITRAFAVYKYSAAGTKQGDGCKNWFHLKINLISWTFHTIKTKYHLLLFHSHMQTLESPCMSPNSPNTSKQSSTLLNTLILT